MCAVYSPSTTKARNGIVQEHRALCKRLSEVSQMHANGRNPATIYSLRESLQAALLVAQHQYTKKMVTVVDRKLQQVSSETVARLRTIIESHRAIDTKWAAEYTPMLTKLELLVSDGCWDHNPRNGEAQLALTPDQLDRECTFTVFVVPASRMSSWNEAERLNGAETRATRNALLREAVLLLAGNDLPPKDALDTHQRRFQTVVTTSIGGAQYAKQHFRSFVSHPSVEGSGTYDHEFRLMCRVALDGKEADIPLETRSRIVCALR